MGRSISVAFLWAPATSARRLEIRCEAIRLHPPPSRLPSRRALSHATMATASLSLAPPPPAHSCRRLCSSFLPRFPSPSPSPRPSRCSRRPLPAVRAMAPPKPSGKSKKGARRFGRWHLVCFRIAVFFGFWSVPCSFVSAFLQWWASWSWRWRRARRRPRRRWGPPWVPRALTSWPSARSTTPGPPTRPATWSPLKSPSSTWALPTLCSSRFSFYWWCEP